MNPAGGKQGQCANGATGWVSSGTISGLMRLSEYRMGSQQMRSWLEWDRGTMHVRDLAVTFTSYAHARRLA
jgi:hypothetical protein